jgi:hypothetical protein
MMNVMMNPNKARRASRSNVSWGWVDLRIVGMFISRNPTITGHGRAKSKYAPEFG